MDANHPHAAWEAARAYAGPGAHVAAYEHHRVILRSALSQYRGIIRDARNIDSLRIARESYREIEARLARLEGR